tara:strand:- start:30 stop:416 length:387 start_codon:yes stop_codon:yes gene_type:complete
MANKNITIGNTTLNDSVSIEDKAYYASITEVNDSLGNKAFDKLGTIIEIGNIKAINKTTGVITIDTATAATPITDSRNIVNTFMLFSKNNAVETSGLKGYYATVKMKNTSTVQSELYSISSEIQESSK